MKHTYYILSIGPDGQTAPTPTMSLKAAKVFKRNLEDCSAPGWKRYIVVQEVSV